MFPTKLHPPVPRVETERLRLRYWTPEDAGLAERALEKNRVHLAPWLPWANSPPETPEAQRLRLARWRELCVQGLDYIWAVFDVRGERLIGGCEMHPRCGEGGLEIGYWIDVDELRRGLATELASALVRIGIQVAQANRIEIHTDVEHEVSARIPRKLGFTEEGVLRERIYFPDGRRRDKRVFSLLDREYPNSPATRVKLAYLDSDERRRVLE